MIAKTVEASFPSNFERTIASALLLLSSSAPEGSSNNSCSSESFESPGISASKSSGRLTIEEASVDEESSRAQQLTVVAFVSDVHELELKIVRKKRSKSIFISNGKKLKTSKPEPTSAPASSESVSQITTTEALSCVSSSSSEQSCASETTATDRLRKPVIPGHMGHRAAAILRILSKGSASEVKLRQLLGDSPSTSKALRMLLKRQEVKRVGAGGRADPYTYTIAS